MTRLDHLTDDPEALAMLGLSDLLDALAVAEQDWRHEARCRDLPPELFFPISNVGPGARQTQRAKLECAACPVRAQCLEWALDALPHGIAGGLDEDERRALRAARPRERPSVRVPA